MLVWGKDQPELFAQAAHGMMSKMAPLRRAGAASQLHTKTVDLSAPTIEDLFVRWLSEVLYLFTVQEFYFADAHFTVLTAENLSATIEGWPVSGLKLHNGIEVKGVTYHALRVVSQPRWEVEVILDV